MRAAEREKYRLHSHLIGFRRKERAALALIEQVLRDYPGHWWISYSGGKDSSVLLDLCARVGFSGSLFFFWYEEMPSENIAAVRAAAAGYQFPLHLLKTPGEFDVYDRVGHFFLYPTTPAEIEAANWMRQTWREMICRYPEEQGWIGGFMGLRMDEARHRRMMLRRKGLVYATQDRSTLTCCPLAEWNDNDIWGYIVARELPYLASYDLAEDRGTHRSEYVFFYEPTSWQHDGLEELRRTNPSYYYRLIQRWPEAKSAG